MERIGAGMEWPEVTEMLKTWARDPESVRYDGFDPLCLKAVEAALSEAAARESRGDPAPDAVAPTPDGGVSMSWLAANKDKWGWEIEFVPGGKTEIQHFARDIA